MTPTESDCQSTIIDACRILGYRVCHFRPARTARGWRTAVAGDAGFCDLVIAGHGRAWFIELKRDGARPPTGDQVAWLTTLAAAGLDARTIWVPSGMQALLGELGAARKVPT